MGSKTYALGKQEYTKEDKDAIINLAKSKEMDRAEAHKAATADFTEEATTTYNRSLLTPDPMLQNIRLPKGKVLLSLFRAPRVLSSGLYLPSTETSINEDTGRLKLVKTDNIDDIKYLSRGVVQAVGEGCDPNLKPGVVVDLYMNAYSGVMQYWSPLNRMDTNFKTPENYFTIAEGNINFIWTTYHL